MGLFDNLVARLSGHPVLFTLARSIIEDDFQAVRSLIRRELDLAPGLRTLDLGCGPGVFADLFARQDYVGADLNRRFIEHARSTRRGTFVVSDARKVELPDRRFEQVLLFGLLHHLPDEDVGQVLAEARRVLVPGGRMLVVEPIPTLSRFNLIGRLLQRASNGPSPRLPEEYGRLCESAGWVAKANLLRSGARDYYVALVTTPEASA